MALLKGNCNPATLMTRKDPRPPRERDMTPEEKIQAIIKEAEEQIQSIRDSAVPIPKPGLEFKTVNGLPTSKEAPISVSTLSSVLVNL